VTADFARGGILKGLKKTGPPKAKGGTPYEKSAEAGFGAFEKDALL
jgi:hypothetical protein